MTATLTLDFSDRLRPEEQRELLAESLRRKVRIEEIVVEALRLRRQQAAAGAAENSEPK